jgi:hypothetical protein
MASKLKAVKPAEAKRGKAKVLIFGEAGVGKTWGALDFPSPYYFDVEDGASQKQYIEKLKASNGVYVGVEQGSQDFGDVLEQVRALSTEQHQYKTVVFDSISKLYNLEIAREHERLIDSGRKDEFGSSKKPAVRYMQSLVAWLQRMDMNALIIAHGKADWGKNAKTGEREEIGKTFDCWEKLSFELDLTLEIFRQGPKRMARVRKTRLEGFEDSEVFQWNYTEFSKRYGEEALTENVKAITLPSEELLTNLYGLLTQKKTPEKDIEKWLNAAKVSSFEEMDAEKVEKIVAYLKQPAKEVA